MLSADKRQAKSYSYKDKLKVVCKPYLTGKDIMILFDCCYATALEKKEFALEWMLKNKYPLINRQQVPTECFLEAHHISLKSMELYARLEKEGIL